MFHSMTELRRILDELEVRPRKRHGQNFLIDRGSIQNICRFAQVDSTQDVLEIGPGLGAITEHLLTHARCYRAVELEMKFADFLLRSLPALNPGDILVQDVRELELSLHPQLSGRQWSLVSNVPYSLSSEILLWILRNRRNILQASLLLQREFAERVAARPGGKDYGSLTVLCRLYADAELGPVISGGCFFPSAEVESRLLKLRMLTTPRVALPDEAFFERIVRASFSARRKTVANSLGGSGLFADRDVIQRILERAGIDSRRRAETLDLDEFAALSRAAADVL
jgi:16S rRNA (adenine1518-N6/adenine1519-N6)-dimethyltransferase